jgi:hypothetical protein
MRAMIATLAGLLALTTVSVQAAPLAPVKVSRVEIATAPPIELARQGCGWGWHRGLWRDRWGYLALGPLLPALVTAARCHRAYSVDDAKRPDLAFHSGLRSRSLL